MKQLVGEPQAPPARISINLPYGKSPANSGAEIIAARGGDTVQTCK
jgi:hypothetical protein